MATQPQIEAEDDVLEQDVNDNDESQSEPEQTEEFARRLGWKPKDEYKGSPDQWVDWQDFLDEERSNAPQLKAQVKVLKRRLDQADRRNAKIERTLEEAKDYFSKAEQRGYERAVKDLQAKQRAAVANADEEAFDEATAELDQITKEMREAKPEKDKPAIDPDVQKAFRKWERDNDWYGSDDVLTAVADRIAQKMGSYQDNDMEPEEYLEELTARVKKQFPDRFGGAAAPKKRSAVEGVSGNRGGGGAETFANMPADAKAQFKRFKDMGIPVTEDGFAKDYYAEMKKGARR